MPPPLGNSVVEMLSTTSATGCGKIINRAASSALTGLAGLNQKRAATWGRPYGTGSKAKAGAASSAPTGGGLNEEERDNLSPP